MSMDRKFFFGNRTVYSSRGKTNNYPKTSKYTKVYSENFQKAQRLEYELERSKDVILKLKEEILNKNKELTLMKKSRIYFIHEHQKIVRAVNELLNRSDQNTINTFKLLKNSMNSEKNVIKNNLEKSNNSDNDIENITENNDQTTKSENFTKNINSFDNKKGGVVNIKKKDKEKLKNLLKIDSLKYHIYNLNSELSRKNDEISELKQNKRAGSYRKIRENLIKNFSDLKDMQQMNCEIKSELENVNHLLSVEKDDNRYLKSKLQHFKTRFELFKELSINKVKNLDRQLEKAKEKEKNFNIFHRTFSGNDNNDIKSNPEYIKIAKKLEEYESEAKKNNELINKYKKENKFKIEENKKLKREKYNLVNNLSELQKENESLNQKIEEISKKLEKQSKNIRKKAEETNKVIKEKNEENSKLKQENEKLKKAIEELKKGLTHNGLYLTSLDDENKNTNK